METMDPTLTDGCASGGRADLGNQAVLYDDFRAGRCAVGAACPRLHQSVILAAPVPLHVQGPSSPALPFVAKEEGSGSQPLPRRKGPCFQFESHGTCRWGNNCRYSHDIQPTNRVKRPKSYGAPVPLTAHELAEKALSARAKLEEAIQRKRGQKADKVTNIPKKEANSQATKPKPKNACFEWEKGRCAKGDQCQYHHDTQKHTEIVTQGGPQSPPPLTVEELAEQALSVRAKLEERIRRSNGQHVPIHVSRQTKKANLANVCFEWEKGYCADGSQCLYRHDMQIHTGIDSAASSRASHVPSIREPGRSRDMGVGAPPEYIQAHVNALDLTVKSPEAKGMSMLGGLEMSIAQQLREIQRVQEEVQRELEQKEEAKRGALQRAQREQEERRKAKEMMQAAIEERKAQAEAEKKAKVQRDLEERHAREQAVTWSLSPPGFELCSVAISNIPRNVKEKDIVELFVREFEIRPNLIHLTKFHHSKDGLRATIIVPLEAIGAIENRALGGIELLDQLLAFQFGANAQFGGMNVSTSAQDPNALSISWRLPSGVMIAKYTSMEDAIKYQQFIDGATIRGRKVKAILCPKPEGRAAPFWTPESVKITNLDLATTTNDLYVLAGTESIRSVKGLVYDTESFVKGLEDRLKSAGALSLAPSKDGSKILARFPSHEVAQQVYEAIQAGQYGTTPILHLSLPKKFLYNITICEEQFAAQKALWDQLAEGTTKQGPAHVRVYEGNGRRRFIQVLGSDPKRVGALKVRVENLVAGTRLPSSEWHDTFTTPHNDFLKDVGSSHKVHIVCDKRFRALRLFGTEADIANARQLIQEEVSRINASEFSVPIPHPSIAFFIKGRGLQIVQDLLGALQVSLHVCSDGAALRVKGGDGERLKVQEVIDNHTPEKIAEGELCSVCGTDVMLPEILGCGHVYCHDCLQHYLASAVSLEKFPIACLGATATCNCPISLPIIKRIVSPEKMEDLLEATYRTYMERHSTHFKCNPGVKTPLKCPSCFREVCIGCSEDEHGALSCEEAHLHRDSEQESLTDAWAAQNGAKKCPDCQVRIVKGEGCNHITCRCGAHICWRCLGSFSTENIYDHLHSTHGGIHDD
ncbi:hypothetical protein BKA70DRAFT_1350484 [Coprinopsis sp. MPI-PUGE-AT-0042]|nr:hypothetical protein BKA70DRAFT_1350484 [Coprinopsis sp. MPI-PUGE-AT-0042]